MSMVPHPDDVLFSLARRGDPVAFLSLFGERLCRAHAALVAGDTSPAESRTQVLQLASTLYHALRRSSNTPMSPRDWYSSQLARLAPQLSSLCATDPSSCEQGDALMEELEVLVQREYSAAGRQHRGAASMRPRFSQAIHSPWLLMTLIAAALCIAGIAIVLVTGSRLEISLTRSGRVCRLSIPSGPAVAAVAAPLPADSTEATDSAAVPDFAPASPPATPRRETAPAQPAPRPAAAVPALSRPAATAPTVTEAAQTPPPKKPAASPSISAPERPAESPRQPEPPVIAAPAPLPRDTVVAAAAPTAEPPAPQAPTQQPAPAPAVTETLPYSADSSDD